MNITKRIVQNYIGKSILNIKTRQIFIHSVLNVKEIHEMQEGNQLIIYGEEKVSPREPFMLKNKQTEKCPVCASGLNIKHTDILILSQFVRSDGCMLPRRVTGLCSKQQKNISTLVTMAQKAGLMPNLAPAWSKKDPKRRYQWKKFNKYFDDAA